MALWTPANISAGLWMDGADNASITLVSGAISQWADKSGNGRNATQGTAGYRPTVTSGWVRWDGMDDFLSVDLSFLAGTTYCFYAVAKRHTTTNSRAYLFGGTGSATNTNAHLGWATSTELRLSQYGNDLNTSDAAAIGTATLLAAGHSGGGKFIRRNGASVASDGSLALLSTNAGGMLGKILSSAQNVSIAELIMVAPYDDGGQVALVEGYLAHKWGLAANLPAYHPYKSAAPTWGGAVVGSLEQLWALSPSIGARMASQVAQDWLLLAAAGQGVLVQPWGLRLGRDLVEPWANATVRVAGLAQPWRAAGELARWLVQPWQDAAPLTAGLAQEWDILGALAARLVQPWAIAADAALVGPLAQGWDLRDVVPLSVDLAQPWTIGTDPAQLRYTLTVTVDGNAVQVDSMTLEADLDQDALNATISLGDLADYQRCRDLAEVVVRVAINGGAAEEYHLVQTSARIDERHGETRYEVQAESALVLLGAPYAEPVAVEEYTGPASVIAATLCAPLTLAWQAVDWALPSDALVAAGETPLELLKRLAAAVGAVVQARPDGSVLIVPEYPLSLPAWPTATPDLVWIETERSEQVAGQPERRPGYNKYLIGETLTAADSLRLEEETISETVKLVRGYQVPWTGLFSLVHTGGSWVQVEDMGIETRQETETVEIVAGEGRVRYPIQSRDSVRWLHTSLGALTVSEDGTVRADVAGQSLCEVTYTTRCRKWRVRDSRNEQLQLVAEI